MSPSAAAPVALPLTAATTNVVATPDYDKTHIIRWSQWIYDLATGGRSTTTGRAGHVLLHNGRARMEESTCTCTTATLLFAMAGLGCSTPPDAAIEIRVLSGPADFVSGGDALVEVIGVDNVQITLNGHDVSSAFHVGPVPGSLIGLVDGLVVGANTLEARADGTAARAVELRNYPKAGPVFSGPHQEPFICETEAAGLGPANDAACSARTVVSHVYKSTDPAPQTPAAGQPAATAVPAGYKPFRPGAPRPADLAQTLTSDGRSVDFIVRLETGTINRAIYQIAFLHRPDDPLPDPWTPTPSWNGRLVYRFGGGCRAGYHQASPPSAIDDVALAAGYAVASSSLNVFGNNCNDVISAETLMMVKEHFIERFGMPVHTIGTGGSGGSMQQHLIAQNYPGLLDGLMPTVSYPDIISIVPGVTDCSLLDHAFKDSGLAWSDEQKTAVSGYATWGTCATSWFNSVYSPGWVRALPTSEQRPTCDASIPRSLLYDPVTNPKGARCDVYETQVNIFGRDQETGLVRRPLDNVGVQYGLKAFNAGTISAEQFLQLNERVGGYDADGNIVAARTVADLQALRTAYQTGRVNTGGGGLAATPIIDLRPYWDPVPDIHDHFRSFVTRARLDAANGGSDNHVILTVPRDEDGRQLAIPVELTAEVLRLMNEWLDSIASDRSDDGAAAKVARTRPPDLADA